MSSAEPELVVPRGDDFVPRPEIPPPDLAATPQIALTSFEASGNETLTVVFACFRGSAPGWNADVDEIVEHKLVDVAVGLGKKLRSDSAMSLTDTVRGAGVTTQVLTGDGLRGGTWLGFRDGVPQACVLACSSRDLGGSAQCATLVSGSHLRAPVDGAAPAEGFGLGALRSMVHHPGATVGAVGAILTVIALALVVRRPKRRRRTHF